MTFLQIPKPALSSIEKWGAFGTVLLLLLYALLWFKNKDDKSNALIREMISAVRTENENLKRQSAVLMKQLYEKEAKGNDRVEQLYRDTIEKNSEIIETLVKVADKNADAIEKMASAVSDFHKTLIELEQKRSDGHNHIAENIEKAMINCSESKERNFNQ